MKTQFSFPEVLALVAHIAGITISIWMTRWDLLAAGIAFGMPSLLLFRDLSPHGKGIVIKFMRRVL